MCLACQTKIQLCMEGTFQSWADIVSRRTIIVFIISFIAFIALCKSFWNHSSFQLNKTIQEHGFSSFPIVSLTSHCFIHLKTLTQTLAFFIFMKRLVVYEHMTRPSLLILSICSNLLFTFLCSTGHVTISLFWRRRGHLDTSCKPLIPYFSSRIANFWS